MTRILLLAALMATACNTNNPSSTGAPNPSVDPRGETQQNQIQVTSSAGLPLVGAKVLIGSAPGKPFQGNLLTTDSAGRVGLPSAWTSALPVSVRAQGFAGITYDAQTPGTLSFELRPLRKPEGFLLRGDLTGFGSLPRDGQIDFGITIPALTKQDLFRLDVSSFLSPQMDKIEVLGQEVEIPGNLVLPTQKERYGIIPINLSKNNYSVSFPAAKNQTITSMHGQFDVGDVVKKMRAKAPLYELIPLLKTKGGSIKTVDVGAAKQNLTVSEISFEGALKLTAPRVQSDELILAVALSQKERVMLPTGIAALGSGQSGYVTATGKLGTPLLATVRKRKADFEQEPPSPRDPDSFLTLSATVELATREASPQNLELVDQPRIAHKTGILLDPPAPLSGVQATATYVTLSKIESLRQGDIDVEHKTLLWESYTPGWVNQVELPELADDFIVTGTSYRWEASFIGQAQTSKVTLGPQVLDQATHVSVSAKSF